MTSCCRRAPSTQGRASRPRGRIARASRRRAGFTLIEVTIAIGLVALFLFPLLIVRNDAIASTGDAQWQRRAAELARQKLAELTLQGIGTVPEMAGTFDTEDGAEYRWELQVTASEAGTSGDALLGSLLGAAGTGDDPDEDEQPSHWEVQLTVFYPSMRLGTRELVVATLLPNPLDEDEPSEDLGGLGY